jgi:hypothetical protein
MLGTYKYFVPSNVSALFTIGIVPLWLVALFPFPDLSFHTEIDVPLAEIPVAFGSAPSSHRIHPVAAERGEVNGEGDEIEELSPIVATAETEYVVPVNPANVADVPCTLIGEADRSTLQIPP